MTDEELVNKLCSIEDGLTNWEVQFIESVAKQVLKAKIPLSRSKGGQREKAEQIWYDKGA